jgi:hypothetical protein
LAVPIVLALAVVCWLFLASRASSILREKHPQAIEALGSAPLAANPAFLKFLFMREYDALEDPALSNHLRFMRGYLGIFVFALVLVLAGVFSSTSPA